VKAAGSLADYLSNPFGRYIAGRTWAHFFVVPELCGLALWERPDVEQVREMVEAIESEAPGRAPVHKSIIDVRRLSGIDPVAFQEFSQRMGQRGAVLGPNVTHHAIVRPTGVVGATVSGFYAVTPTNFPDRIKVFDSMEEALRWMGHAASVGAEIDAMVDAVRAVPAALQTVRKLIAEQHGKLTLREAARSAGVSARTLQSQLLAAGTSLRAENNAARVAWAQRLLDDTDHKITSIAFEVGCSSLQHFSTMFQKATGMSPSAWRSRKRVT
jgi:AraC-like DNA-binding protein